MELSFHRLRMVEGAGQSFCSKALSSCALSFCKLFSSSPESICTRPVGDHLCNYKKGGRIVNRVISRGMSKPHLFVSAFRLQADIPYCNTLQNKRGLNTHPCRTPAFTFTFARPSQRLRSYKGHGVTTLLYMATNQSGLGKTVRKISQKWTIRKLHLQHATISHCGIIQ